MNIPVMPIEASKEVINEMFKLDLNGGGYYAFRFMYNVNLKSHCPTFIGGAGQKIDEDKDKILYLHGGVWKPGVFVS